MSNLIITYYKESINNSLLFKKFLISFVISLRELANYNDHIILISYSVLSQVMIKFLKEYKIEIKVLSASERIINNRRFIDTEEFTNKMNYENIILCDIDVWFQKSINDLFLIIDKSKGFVYTPDIHIPFQRFNNLLFKDRLDNKEKNEILIKKIFKLIRKYGTILNVGILGFKKENFKFKIEKYKEYFIKRNHIDEYGLDTFIMIYLFDFNKDIIISPIYNFLAKQKAILKMDLWFTTDNEEIAIIHMAGGSRIRNPEYFFWNNYPVLFNKYVKNLIS